jgi:hypothetical protein
VFWTIFLVAHFLAWLVITLIQWILLHEVFIERTARERCDYYRMRDLEWEYHFIAMIPGYGFHVLKNRQNEICPPWELEVPSAGVSAESPASWDLVVPEREEP